jgi:hypothetical protein
MWRLRPFSHVRHAACIPRFPPRAFSQLAGLTDAHIDYVIAVTSQFVGGCGLT